jgi:lysophospholipase L1-like esterase
VIALGLARKAHLRKAAFTGCVRQRLLNATYTPLTDPHPHPNKDGYRVIAEMIYSYLSKSRQPAHAVRRGVAH